MGKKSRKVKAYNASKSDVIKYKRQKVDVPLPPSDDSDVNPDDLFHDEIDDYHEKKDNELSTDDELIQHKRDSSDEEEVLPITDDEKDESDKSDLEGQESEEQDDEDLPNRDAWGKKKSMYYSADFVDQDRGKTYREEDAEAAKAEEKEAIAIQKSLYHNIDTNNLGSHLFFESSEESSEDEEVKKEPETKEEILRYMKKETKFFEYKELILSTIQNLKKTLKLWTLIDCKKIKSKRVLEYVKLRKEILALLMHNIIMYYMFLSKGKDHHQALKHHPVHKRIAQFKKLFDDLEAKDPTLSPLIDVVLEKHENGEEIDINSDVEDNANESSSQSEPGTMKKLVKNEAQILQIENAMLRKESAKLKKEYAMLKQKSEDIVKRTNSNHLTNGQLTSKVKHVETENEKEVLSLIKGVKEEVRIRKHENEEKSDQDSDDDKIAVDQGENNEEKRFISYEIAKNKGLVPHRKKEYRNPRVRHRMKYRKAQISRKGQVREVVKEIKRYGGEPTGINKNVVKSVKFK